LRLILYFLAKFTQASGIMWVAMGLFVGIRSGSMKWEAMMLFAGILIFAVGYLLERALAKV